MKTLFFEHEELAPRQRIEVLRANYRNAVEVTDLANRLLRLKLARFGSIDRESHYLVEALPANRGSVELLSDRDGAARELDAKTHRSVRFAVIVLREEDKPQAAARFRTPLLFSVQEAKGLEYDNIILYNLEFVGYQEAGSFVEYLLESQGDGPMRELFRRGGRDDGLDQIRGAFQASFGFSLVEAERRWRAFLGGHA